MTRTLAALAVALALPAQAGAQTAACAPYPQISGVLAGVHGEAPQMRLDLGDGARLEIWVDTSDGGWTVLHALADGTACARAVGEGFSVLRDLSGLPS